MMDEGDTLPAYFRQADIPVPYTPIASTSSPTPIIRAVSTRFPLPQGSLSLDAPGDLRHVQVSAKVGLKPVISGHVTIDAPKAIKSVSVLLRGLIEYTRGHQRGASDNTRIEDKARNEGSSEIFKSFVWIFSSQKVQLWPVENDVGAAKGQIDLPFCLELPATYPGKGGVELPLPPSLQLESHGIRYFLRVRNSAHPFSLRSADILSANQITIDPYGVFKKKTRSVIPLVFIPVHPPALQSPGRLVAIATSSKSPGPLLDPEGWNMHACDASIAGEEARMKIWVSNPAVFAREDYIEWLLVIELRKGKSVASLNPQSLTVELVSTNPWSRKSDSVKPPTARKANS
ncbi:hypothetical protein P7C70_g1564, partial [Phenoliferia sp. Uapishka_3]